MLQEERKNKFTRFTLLARRSNPFAFAKVEENRKQKLESDPIINLFAC